MFLVALPRSSKQSAFLLFFCDLSNTWKKITRTKISEMKPVISICPCGVAIQYIAEKTRRVGSRSKTVTGNTHCIALWVYGLTPKMIRPSKTDCFLRAKISDLKKPLPKLDTISDPNSSLFSGAIARPQSPTSWRKKNWFKLSYQNWPMKLPETRSWHGTRTWSIVSRSDWQELIKGTILETSTSIFSLVSSWYVYLNQVLKRKNNEGLQSFQQILRCWQSTCFSGFWGSYLGIASEKSTFFYDAPR